MKHYSPGMQMGVSARRPRFRRIYIMPEGAAAFNID
jgi:hypothetical protein